MVYRMPTDAELTYQFGYGDGLNGRLPVHSNRSAHVLYWTGYMAGQEERRRILGKLPWEVR